MDAAWARHEGRECLVVSGWAADLEDLSLRVVPAGLQGDGLPSMAGEVSVDGGVLRFVPRFPFAAGTAYAVTVNGETCVVERPREDAGPAAEVVAIHPDVEVVPENLLRIYVQFSAAMSEGYVARAVEMRSAGSGEVLEGTFLRPEPELWDSAHRRLTLFLDPARIKRGLVPNAEVGYPLREGEAVVLRVGEEMRDARGRRLGRSVERSYGVGAAIRARIDVDRWEWRLPRANSIAPLRLGFDRVLDHAMLGRCLWVTGDEGRISGDASIQGGGTAWEFTPDQPWQATQYTVVVDATLEDVCGNAVAHVFDRDLDDPSHDPIEARHLQLPFTPR